MTVRRPIDAVLDETALTSEQIYRRHAQQVARWAARLAGPALDVEDLVQEIFLKVHRGRDAFRGDCRLATWLYCITERVVYARRRRERIRRFLGGTIAADDTPATDPTPAQALESRQTTEVLYRALDRLREGYRIVVILFEIEGLSCDEIAELKNLPVTAVWARLSRGRVQLLRELERMQRSRPWR